MDGFRIANFIMQAVYLPIHMLFIARLVKARQASPVWKWFTIVIVGLWMLIFGRFMESVLYLFYENNDIYTFAVYIQLVGTVMGTAAYVIWNLYLAKLERLADSRIFKGIILSLSLVICFFVCSSFRYRLFYDKLVMGESVTHGILFVPSLFFVYGTLMAGWILSIVHIAKHGQDKFKRIIVFSMYPLLPGLTNLFRSISGVDRIDTNPLVMSVSIYCLYVIVFKNRYAGVLAQSVEQALFQTRTPIAVYSLANRDWIYFNKIAVEQYEAAFKEIENRFLKDEEIFADNSIVHYEGKFDGKDLKIDISVMGKEEQIQIALTDVTSINEELSLLATSIAEKNQLLLELEEKKRNIDAYVEALYQIPDLKEKQELIDSVQKETADTFNVMKNNLQIAKEDVEAAKKALMDNIEIAQKTITSVRAAVAKLKEV